MNRLRRTLFSLLAALLLAVFLIGCIDSSGDGSTSFVEVSAEEEEWLIYPGFTDRILDWDNRTLTLSNDEQNTANLIFTITNGNGDVLYTSDPIAPGEQVEWDAVSSGLSSGYRTVTITTTAVTDDGEELNSVTQTITVRIPSAED